MKHILETRLGSVKKSLNDAYQQCDQRGVIYYETQEQLLLELLDECNHQECSYDQHEYYYDDADEFYSDPLEDYYSDLAYYKQQEIDDIYNKHNQHSWFLGKDVMAIDSYWFTSDEIEAFREIWQRRISAL